MFEPDCPNRGPGASAENHARKDMPGIVTRRLVWKLHGWVFDAFLAGGSKTREAA